MNKKLLNEFKSLFGGNEYYIYENLADEELLDFTIVKWIDKNFIAKSKVEKQIKKLKKTFAVGGFPVKSIVIIRYLRKLLK